MASSTAESSSGSRPVFVITGTSGEGKSTLAKRLVERVPELRLAVSATTRPRRPGEEDGRDYWFLSDKEFDKRLEDGDFLEWVTLPWGEGYRSGTLWSELDRITAEGRSPLLEIETGGALAVRDRVPAAVTIFVTAYDQYALRAFDVHALDYLVKPFDDRRFYAALLRAKDLIDREFLAEHTTGADEFRRFRESRIRYDRQATERNLRAHHISDLKHAISEVLEKFDISGLEAEDIDEALEFWESIFGELPLRVRVLYEGEEVLGECMHIFGGSGYLVDETPLGSWWRDMKLARVGGGTDEVLWELVAAAMKPDYEGYAEVIGN